MTILSFLFYSTNEEKAKKLIHAKKTKDQRRALRKQHCFERLKLNELKAQNRIGYSAIDNLRAAHLEEIRNLKGSYTEIVLPKKELQICIVRPGNNRRWNVRKALV